MRTDASGRPGLENATIRRYVLAEVAFGACFPLTAWALDILVRGVGWSIGSLAWIHSTNPLHWIVDSAPIVLGVMGYLIGRAQAQIEAHNRELEVRVRERTAQLAASEERFRSLVQHASDVIAVVDAGGVLTYVSPSCLKVCGHDPAQLVGTLLANLLHPEDVAQAARFLSDASSRKSSTSAIEWRIRHRDGTYRLIEVLGTNLLDDSNVGGLVLNGRDVTERQALEAQLAHQAFHDSLTGLANRALFRDRLAHALERARRTLRPLTVIFLDLDDFKAINDSLGHEAGDELLVGVAERLVGSVRASDTVARLGGDEFAVLVEDGDADEVLEVADRMLESLRTPFFVADREVFVVASIGLTSCESNSATAEDLLRDADAAMYHAKRAGGARVERFQPGLHTAALERLALATDLRRALEREEFEVHYQPIIDLATEHIRGVEALVRWRHPERGLMSPLTFIPLAEETGLIGQLGLWVLRTGCQDVRAWQRLQPVHETPLNLSVNLSARQLQEPRLVDQVAEVLAQTGLDPATLTLEITEGMLLHDAEGIMARLRALKDLGINLALDDFGTGYSSLSYLQRFPIDVLKIDKSFVDRITEGTEATALVRTIVALSEALKLRTVAEGIEEPEQLEHLRVLGCHGGQGYFFAKPLPADQLRQKLMHNRSQAWERAKAA
jgi:diguanylate cyclase (GGDEF)-like protein/PAS domain S-box-containing protein